jgi:predicted outer membrane protein
MFIGTLAFALPAATSGPVEPTLRMSIAGKGVVETGSDVAMSDESFSKTAALGNLDELELSRVAQERSRNLRVKLLADRVLKDRSSISARLAATARKKNVKLPGGLGLEQQAVVSKLKLQPDATFDTAYVMRMREENVKAIALFERAKSNPALSHEMRAVAGEGLKILLGSQQQTLAIEVPVKTVRVIDPV